MMTAPLYMSGNTRKTMYELVSFVGAERGLVND